MRIIKIAMAVFVFLGMPAGGALAGTFPQIWLVPLDNYPHPGTMPQGAADYEALFAKDATWPETLPQVKVFEIYGYFASVAPDAELSALFGFMRRHHIRMALEQGVLTTPPTCGAGQEGFNGNHLAGEARRIKQLGGTIDYLSMDEPLFNGAYSPNTSGCHLPLAVLAANAAQNIQALKKVFPKIKVGEVEVANPSMDIPAWAADMTRWSAAFAQATGAPLAYMHLDVSWHFAVHGEVEEICKTLHHDHLRYGVIFNGLPLSGTDKVWAQTAAVNYKNLREAGYVPDDVLFQTWMSLPTHVLPPDDPVSLTGIVKRYVEYQSGEESSAF